MRGYSDGISSEGLQGSFIKRNVETAEENQRKNKLHLDATPSRGTNMNQFLKGGQQMSSNAVSATNFKSVQRKEQLKKPSMGQLKIKPNNLVKKGAQGSSMNSGMIPGDGKTSEQIKGLKNIPQSTGTGSSPEKDASPTKKKNIKVQNQGLKHIENKKNSFAQLNMSLETVDE